MNKDLIHKAIENPELTLNSGIEDLEKISSQYPWFGTAQLLLTKAYRNKNDYRYIDQLHQAAIYSADRRHLYNWIKSNPVATTEESEVVVEIESPETSTESTVVDTLVPTDKLKLEDTVETAQTEEGVVTILGSDLIIPTDEDVEGLVRLILDDEPKPQTVTTDSDSPTEKSMTVLTPKSGVQTLETEESEQKITEELPTDDAVQIENESHTVRTAEFDPVEKEILLEAMQSSIELELEEEQVEAVSKSTDSTVIAIDTDEAESTEADSFASWVYLRAKQLQSYNEGEVQALPDLQSAGDTNEEISTKNTEEDEIPTESERNISHGIKKLSPAKTSQQTIIDRFISSEPKITRGKAVEYNVGDLAKESLEEDFSFVTETMAVLYAQQGKLDKARKAFKKLIEQFPEKSVYFAAQLKNLDKYKK